ncbi:MAG: hypothetical protein EOR81_10985 [Mesorhizobium sp.]|nr:MAG: hypothetical protein EOR81_10985 [Mesorhizobium sp.]
MKRSINPVAERISGINIKVTAETKAKFKIQAIKANMSMGAYFEIVVEQAILIDAFLKNQRRLS